MESPILFPASHFLFRSAAAGLTGGIDRQSGRETRDIKPEQPSRIIIIHVVEIACATDQQKKLDELKVEVFDQYRVN